jgi:ATP-dependent Clp protease ATP-binding subunit ClpA
MFERFTERARRVIFFARYEASQFGSTTIESEHFLLGLVREDKNLTNRFLRNSSAIESIRKEIEGRTTIREKVSTSIDLPLSDECKRILAYSAEESERLNHRHIGTEHLLLGILREEKCLAAKILDERGLRLSTIREELSRSVADRQNVIDPTHSDAQQVEVHKDAMVPDAIAAKRIAQAIWTPVYGAETVANSPDVQAKEDSGNWLVVAGQLFAYIRMQDGKVLWMGQKPAETDV